MLDASLHITRVTPHGAVTVCDSRYLEYRNDLGDFSDDRIAALPETVFGASARWDDAAGLSADVTVEGAGSYFADDANTASAAAYGLLGGRVGFERMLGRNTLRAFVAGDNLLPKQYVASLFINGISGEYFEPGLPRNWSAGLDLRWQ